LLLFFTLKTLFLKNFFLKESLANVIVSEKANLG
jgi:hypothetical protein